MPDKIEPADDAKVAELKRLCEASTRGPWYATDPDAYGWGSLMSEETKCPVEVRLKPNTAFIAACNPGVLRLIARIEQQQAEIAKMRTALEWYANPLIYQMFRQSIDEPGIMDEGEIWDDGGERARVAIGQEPSP